MKCTVNTSKLQKEMTLVYHAVRKTSVPILSHFMLEAQGEHLRIFASDGELQYVSSIPAKIEKEGKVAVPIRYVNDVVRAMAEEEVCLESDALPKVKICSGSTEFVLYGAHPEEFPLSLFSSVSEPVIEVPAPLFLNAVQVVQKAVPTRSVREALIGAYFEWKENVFTMVGVDVHHVAYFAEDTEVPAPEPFSEIIHHKALSEVEYILEEEDVEKVGIARDERTMSFRFDQRRIGIRLIDDTFPDYTIFFLTDAKQIVKVPTQEFLEKVKRILLISKELPKHTIPYIALKVGPTSIEIAYEHPVAGKARDVISCELEGKPFKIHINGRDVLDFFPCIPTEKTVLYFKSEEMPIIVRPEDGRELEERKGIWFITMPLGESEEEEDYPA